MHFKEVKQCPTLLPTIIFILSLIFFFVSPNYHNVTGCHPGTVAFTAKLNVDDSYPCHSGVLKFTIVLVNEGEGYSPDTGIFSCPVDGFYHFTVHVSVYGRGQCAIFKNREKVVSLYHTSLPDKCSQVASMSSVIKLSKQDEVWVNIWGPGRNDIFATQDNDTVFTGVRLG